MSYNLKISKNIQKEVQKSVDFQLEKILLTLSDDVISQEKKIHKIRKVFKKIRALLKLIKYDLKDKEVYTTQNQFYKNASKVFSKARDNVVLVKTFKKIVKEFDLDQDKYNVLVQYLEPINTEEKFKMLKKQIKQMKKKLYLYQLKKKEKPLKKSLKKIYKKLKKNKKKAYKTNSDADFHEWRKAVKNYMYQLKLLHKNFPKSAKKSIKKLEKLADILGFDHDITVLKSFILSKHSHDPMVKYLEKEQKYLRKKASKIKLKNLGLRKVVDFSV